MELSTIFSIFICFIEFSWKYNQRKNSIEGFFQTSFSFSLFLAHVIFEGFLLFIFLCKILLQKSKETYSKIYDVSYKLIGIHHWCQSSNESPNQNANIFMGLQQSKEFYSYVVTWFLLTETFFFFLFLSCHTQKGKEKRNYL